MKGINKIILLVVLAVGCAKPNREGPAESALSKKINTYLTETVERLKLPGLTVAITRNDSILYSGAFGSSSIATQAPMKPENVFHWASVSKTFVATAILQLWEQKKINLDEKLVTYLPYFKQQDVGYQDITIRQMLNHTSGIGDVDDYEWDKPQYDSLALERFVRSTANDKMLFAPGTDWKYSNTAYETLGAVIAQVSGMSFETYVRKHILEPLEMNTSSFLYPEIPGSLRVTGHQWAGEAIVSKHYPYNRMHGPSSTLNSSVLDMTHYAFAHLHRGAYKDKRILADSTYNFMWTNSVAMPDKPKIGLAWWLEERNGAKLVMHSGGDTGFRSVFMLIPEKNMSIQLVCNYELIRTYDLAAALFDIVMTVEPLPAKRQIGFDFAEVMKAYGTDSAKAFFNRIQADTVKRKYYIWNEDEAAFAYPGYLYLEQSMYPEAIEVFKFNVEQFPKSGWALSHLATGYAQAGEKDLARQYYNKAITWLPDEAFFKEELKKLEK